MYSLHLCFQQQVARVEKEKTVAYKRLAELIAQKQISEYGTTLAPRLSHFSFPHG